MYILVYASWPFLHFLILHKYIQARSLITTILRLSSTGMFNLVCFRTNIILIVRCTLHNVEFDIEGRLRNTEYRNIIIQEGKSN